MLPSALRRPEELGVRIPGELLVELLIEGPLLVVGVSATIPLELNPDVMTFSVSARKITRSILFLVIPEEQAPLSRWWSIAEGDVKRLSHPLREMHFTLSISG